MAPPPVADLFDWRVPYVALLAMICVSRVYESEAFGDGLRAPPRTGRFSPAARANGVARSAASPAAATIPGPGPRKGRRLRGRGRIGGVDLLGRVGGGRQGGGGPEGGAPAPLPRPCTQHP